MERNQINHLGYITPIENVPSILENGLLCHNAAKGLNPKSIAAAEIQARRKNRMVPGGKQLHDYVNLYLNPRNPMMYLRKGSHASLCILQVSTDVLDWSDVVVTDQNAAGDWVKFSASPTGLKHVIYERTFAENWTGHEDYRDNLRHKAQMCAEVLVPETIPSNLIVGAYVSCNSSKDQIDSSCFVQEIEVKPYLFFR